MRRFAPLTLAAVMTAATLPACSGGMASQPGAAASARAPAAAAANSLRVTENAMTPPTPSSGPAALSSLESAHVHPLEITPDGTKVLTVNTPNNDVEVFAISGSTLKLASVIKVGSEPVSVRMYSATQAWVVNKISNSVSIIDITTNALIATLQTSAEPEDVVFRGTAGSATNPPRAYVSGAQARELDVFDPVSPGAKTLARIAADAIPSS